jgi:hypothetical protein
MPIYEADFLGKPEPIKKQRVKKVKELKEEKTPVEEVAKPKRKRVKQEETPSASSVAASEEIQPVQEQPVPPKRKRVAKPKPQPSEQLILETKEEKPNAEPEVIKKAASKKGLTKKEKIIDGKAADEPPSWFKAWCLDQKKRENDEKPKKEKVSKPILKESATIEAKEKWNDGLTKDRVKMEVDNHMGRLYNQIYGRRL